MVLVVATEFPFAHLSGNTIDQALATMRGEVPSPTAAAEADEGDGEGGGEGGSEDGGAAGPVTVGGADSNWVPRRPAQLVELLTEV